MRVISKAVVNLVSDILVGAIVKWISSSIRRAVRRR